MRYFAVIGSKRDIEGAIIAGSPYILFRPQDVNSVDPFTQGIQFWICDPGTFSNRLGGPQGHLFSIQDYIEFLATRLVGLARATQGMALSFDVIPGTADEARVSWQANIENFHVLVQEQKKGNIPPYIKIAPVIHYLEPIDEMLWAIHKILGGWPAFWALGGLVGAGKTIQEDISAHQFIAQAFDSIARAISAIPRVHLLGQFSFKRLILRPFMSHDVSYRKASFLGTDWRTDSRRLRGLVGCRKKKLGARIPIWGAHIQTIKAYAYQALRATFFHELQFGYSVDPEGVHIVARQ